MDTRKGRSSLGNEASSQRIEEDMSDCGCISKTIQTSIVKKERIGVEDEACRYPTLFKKHEKALEVIRWLRDELENELLSHSYFHNPRG